MRSAIVLWSMFGAMLLIATLFEKRKPIESSQLTSARVVDWKLVALRTVAGNYVYGPATASATMFVNAMGGGWIHLRADDWWFLLSVVVVILVTDFLAYFAHRAQHTCSLLWSMHSLHHSAEALTVITGARHFWLERIVIELPIFTILGFFFVVPGAVLALTTLLYLALGDGLAHLNMRVSFGRFALWVNNPQLHRIHHSIEPKHRDKNFCKLLPLFDVIFGTAWKPEGNEFPATGLVGETATGFIDGLIWPVRHRVRRLVGAW